MTFTVQQADEYDGESVEVEASPDDALEAAIARAEIAFRRLERRVTAPPADQRPHLLH